MPASQEDRGRLRLGGALAPRTMLGTLIRERSVVIGAALLLLMVLAALIVPAVMPYDPYGQDLRSRLVPPVWDAEGSWQHVLGADALGRDYLTRLLLGARTSFQVSALAVGLSALFGGLIGLFAGYQGRWIDTILMRLADIQLAFPFIVLVIALLSALRPTVVLVALVLAVADWVIYARLARGLVLTEKEKEYTLAARALGARPSRIMFRHVVPNILPVLVVIGALEFGNLVQLEALISFLGLGIQPPTASWGNMLGEARTYLTSHPWLILLPGAFLLYTVFAINLLADGLRNVLDPTSHR